MHVAGFGASLIHSHVSRDSSYNILLIQRDLDLEGKVKTLAVFVLHEQTGNVQKAHDAFEAIRLIVEPLVDDCNVMLTANLLKQLILPHPRDPAHLVTDLVEIMHSKVHVSSIVCINCY